MQVAPSIDKARLKERLRGLVQTPSENPPGDEAAAGALVAGYCLELGLDVVTHEPEPGRPSVVARWDNGDGPTLCFCSHLDVVPAGDPILWARPPFGGEEAEGRLHGRGSCDAKGPVAAALEAVAALRQSCVPLAGTLELALVADEETMGFKGAGALVGSGVLDPDMAIVGEPTSIRVVRAQRGASWLRITTRGVAGHGSAPERGVNAILHMAEIVLRLEECLPDITHNFLGRPSLNVGTIAGGSKVNIIPAGCVVEVDRRTIPGETRDTVLESVHRAIATAKQRRPDIDAQVEVGFFGNPFEMPEDARLVEAVAASAAQALGRDAELVGFRGASDARFFAERGAEVVVFGPGDIGLAHTARESIDLGELEAGALAYALAFATLLSPEAAG